MLKPISKLPQIGDTIFYVRKSVFYYDKRILTDKFVVVEDPTGKNSENIIFVKGEDGKIDSFIGKFADGKFNSLLHVVELHSETDYFPIDSSVFDPRNERIA